MKWRQVALTACIVLTMTGCQHPKKSMNQQVLRLNLSEDPISLDPRNVRSLKDLTVVKQLFEGLTRLDEQGHPQLALASKVEISEDQTTYTFTLRDALWSNGDRVTAEDFISSWSQVLNPQFACDYSHLLYPLKNARSAREEKCPLSAVGMTALNDSTLVIQLENPTPYFLELTAFPTYFPVNHALEQKDVRWALPPGDLFVCNGPFRIKQWNPQVDLLLEKNPSYWDANAVTLEEIAFTVLSDHATEALLFEKRELDWLGQPVSFNIAPELLSKMRSMGKITSYPVAGTFWFKFNTDQPPFHHAKIRKAFSLAICRNDIITHLLQGNQQAATGPLPPSMCLQKTPYFQDGDLDAAQRLFEEALQEEGWTRDTFPKTSLSYPPTERNVKIAQLVQQQWQNAFEIPIHLNSVELQVYRRQVRQGLFQVGTGDWIADFNDPVAFLEIFKYRNDETTGSGMNDTGWQNPAFISFLELSLHEKDPIQRKELLHAAEQILVEEMPVAPVYHFSFDYAKQAEITGVVLSPLGIADFKHAKKITREPAP